MTVWHEIKQWVWPDNFWRNLTSGKYLDEGKRKGIIARQIAQAKKKR